MRFNRRKLGLGLHVKRPAPRIINLRNQTEIGQADVTAKAIGPWLNHVLQGIKAKSHPMLHPFFLGIRIYAELLAQVLQDPEIIDGMNIHYMGRR